MRCRLKQSVKREAQPLATGRKIDSIATVHACKLSKLAEKWSEIACELSELAEK
jgi:hypothetical protein